MQCDDAILLKVLPAQRQVGLRADSLVWQRQCSVGAVHYCSSCRGAGHDKPAH